MGIIIGVVVGVVILCIVTTRAKAADYKKQVFKEWCKKGNVVYPMKAPLMLHDKDYSPYKLGQGMIEYYS